MGAFSVEIAIGDVGGENYEKVEALVDTGATTTVVPGSTLRRLGIAPTKRETFEYAGGQRVELDMAEAIGKPPRGLSSARMIRLCSAHTPWKAHS